jgi:protein-tyrosine phosphatase
MAEFVMKDFIEKAGAADEFYIESAATSTEELGNPVYPPARRVMAEHGISCAGKYARQITQKDYNKFDIIICMDNNNVRNALRYWGGDPESKITRLLDYTNRPGEVADPWYSGNFDATWRDVTEGCRALLDKLL